jgi:hypothetical protein
VPNVTPEHDPSLRQAVLAATVLYDLPVVPDDFGVTVGETRERSIAWVEIWAALGGRAADSPAGRVAVADFLVSLCRLVPLDTVEVAARVRPMALPPAHAVHPGDDWIRARVMGDALDLGLGVVGTGVDPDRVEPLLPGVAESLGLTPSLWWSKSLAYLEEMGVIAAERLRRDPAAPLRPMGDCDVVTLLASTVFRRALVAGHGLRTAAVPMRRRGWLDLSRTDPAFALAAAAAVDEEERAFPRPLLITADEVVCVRPGGNPAEQVLREPVAQDPRPASVPYY